MMLVSLMRMSPSAIEHRKCAGIAWLQAARKLRTEWENAHAGSRHMRVRHPGVRSAGRVPGICTKARTRRRYAVGGSPTLRAKRALKLPRLEKPTSIQTSVTE